MNRLALKAVKYCPMAGYVSAQTAPQSLSSASRYFHSITVLTH